MTTEKPHRGNLSQCSRHYVPNQTDNLGYYYRCHFENHPFLRDDIGTRGHTSMIVKEEGDEIETLNSRYTIIERWPEVESGV